MCQAPFPLTQPPLASSKPPWALKKSGIPDGQSGITDRMCLRDCFLVLGIIAKCLLSLFLDRLSVQNPLRLNDYTEPQPDIVSLKHRSDGYRGKRPEAADALLVLEVADTTLNYDRNVKLPRYAKAGVPEVWIEDVESDTLLVFRNPSGGAFGTTLKLGRGDTVFVEAFPEVTFTVNDLLG